MKTFLTRDTIVHPIPSGYIFFDGFQRIGWQTYYVPPAHEGGSRLVDYDYNGTVDILFDYQNILTNPGHVEELKLFKEQNPSCKIFVSAYLPYDHNHTTELDKRFEGYKGVVDFFFNSTIQHKRAESDFKSLGLTYISIPYPSIAYPTSLENIEPTYDCSFIGTIDSGDRLTDIWYPEIVKPSLRTFLAGFNGHRGVEFKEMISISAQTKVNLNPHYEYQIKESENDTNSRIDFNTRVLNLATMGCFQLTNHPTVQAIFGDSCPIFDRSNFKEVFEHYLHNDLDREKVTKNIQEIALTKYTSKTFAQKIAEGDFNFL